MESHYNRRRKCIDGSTSIKLMRKMEDSKQAKEDGVVWWLGSKPLFDEIADYQFARSNIIASKIKSQLEATKARIKSKRDEELKATTLINELNDKLDETCGYIEQLKMKIHEECRKKSELKKVLRMRKQTLEALQLTHRALRFESEASGASAAQALQYISRSQNDNNTTIQLTVLEYDALTREAKEDIFLNDWRVSVSTEQRLAAQDSRDLAYKILERLYYPDNDSKHCKTEYEIRDRSVGSQDKKEHLQITEEEEEEEEDPEIICPTRSPQHLVDVSEHIDDTKLVPIRKKPSVLAQIRIFFSRIVYDRYYFYDRCLNGVMSVSIRINDCSNHNS